MLKLFWYTSYYGTSYFGTSYFGVLAILELAILELAILGLAVLGYTLSNAFALVAKITYDIMSNSDEYLFCFLLVKIS